MNLADALAQGLRELGCDLTQEQQHTLLAYIELMRKWNRVYNLTAVRDPVNMLYQHLLDSLAVLPYLEEAPLLDIGSGGGLPGIPLAIVRPGLPVTLLDSNQKKTTFLRQAVIELKLPNVTVVASRVEGFSPAEAYAQIVSRAFSELADFVRLASPLCARGGRLLAMKGVFPHDEIGRLPAGSPAPEVFPLRVPGLDAQRHLVIMSL